MNLVTEDYEYVRCYDSQSGVEPCPTTGDEVILEAWRHAVDAHRKYMEELRAMVRTSELDRGLTQCHHCGAHIRYGAIMHHKPTDTYIAVGEICLENRFERATQEFQSLRKAAQLDRERHRVQSAMNEFIDEHPDLGFMANDPATNLWPIDARGNEFIEDVARRFRRYGDMSERQVDAIRRSMTRTRERRYDRETEVWVPIPREMLGRNARISGTIIHLKWQESMYGSTLKMLVKVDAQVGGGSFKVWSTVPKALQNPEKGDAVTVTGELDVSDDDPCFGFLRYPKLTRKEKDS